MMKVWPAMHGAAVATVTLLGTASAAHAQVASRERVTELAVTLDGRYDSNIARTGQARATTRGLKRSDERLTPSVQLTIARPVGRNMLSVHAEAGYDFYNRNHRLNRERLSLGANARVAAGPCDVTLAPTFYRRQSDLADIAFLDTPGIESVRNTETVQDYSAEVRCGRQYGLRPLATIERGIGNNSNDRRRISDYRRWEYGAGLGYGNPTLGDYTVRYAREETHYPGRPASLGRSSYKTDRVSVTGKRDIGSVLIASGGLSYIALTPDKSDTPVAGQPNIGRSTSLGYNLSLTALPAPDLRVTGSFARDVTPSLGTDALYQVGRDYSLGATYALSSRFSVSLTGAYDSRNYVGAGTTYGPPLTKSVQKTVSSSVSYTPSRRLGFALDIGYQNRNANGTLYDYDDFFAGLRTKITL